jgi:hypothetical protein
MNVSTIKVLGVTVSPWFSVTDHVNNLLAACAQTMFAMRTLKQHGLPANSLRAIFKATVVAKLSYASPAWWGFASAADEDRLEAFLRRSGQLKYREKSSPILASICDEAEGDCSITCYRTRSISYTIFCLLVEMNTMV